MSTKVKSNILYIASDDSSEHSQQEKTSGQMQSEQIKLVKNAFALSGSHRLNNNLISKGFFTSQVLEKDFEYQSPKPLKQLQALSGSIQLNPRASRKSTINSTKLARMATLVALNQEQQKKDMIQQVLQVKPKTRMLRSKTLMFQFNELDNQIQKPQQQTQSVKKSIQEVLEKQQQESQKLNSPQSSKKVNNQEITTLTPTHMKNMIDKKQFVLLPVPRNHVLEARILKKNEITNLLYSQFDMSFRNYLIHVASCKKILANIGSNYRISIDTDDFSYCKRNLIGKVRSRDVKQVYNIYDNDTEPVNDKQGKDQLKQILATVRIRTGKGPRELEVYLLKSNSKFSDLLGERLGNDMNLETLYSIEENRKHIQVLKSRKPQWVPSKGEYFLNFRGLIKEASIRNFILEDPITRQEALLFGKAANNQYNINISYPLSPMLGLAIAVPQLDRDD